jgi:ABC-type thiamine transport system ATPase subunit
LSIATSCRCKAAVVSSIPVVAASVTIACSARLLGEDLICGQRQRVGLALVAFGHFVDFVDALALASSAFD